MRRLEGRVALVTGAASSIGETTAHRLAAEGCAVIVADIADEDGEAVAMGIRDTGGSAAHVHHDVNSKADWDGAVDRAMTELGRLDVSVNNAGMCHLAAIEDTTLEARNNTIAIDQTGVFLGMRTAASALEESGHGSVIDNSSIFGTSDASFVTGLELCIDGGFVAR